jgi:uridine phosphorylase
VIAAACLAAGAGDVDRIQGVITELHPQGFILATEGRTVVVDMSALGGITMALARGQAIVAIGTLAPDGTTFHAVRLETPAQR